MTWPKLPAVVASGYAPSDDVAHTLGRLRAEFLPKPFTGRQPSVMLRQQIALATGMFTPFRGIADLD